MQEEIALSSFALNKAIILNNMEKTNYAEHFKSFKISEFQKLWVKSSEI